MTTKYVTGHFGRGLIADQVIDKETEKSVWVQGRRCQKRSSWLNYFDSWEEAHAFLMEGAVDALNTARRRLDVARGHHGNIIGLKPPKS